MSLETGVVLEQMDRAVEMYHRLVLVVAPSGAGKTSVLQAIAQARGVPCINVNLGLSKRMLDLTTKQRAIHAASLLREIVEDGGSNVAVLDNIEILFDQSLKQDPLRLLKDVARSRVIVSSWNGTVDGQGLSYAQPDHPEYHHYPSSELDFLCLTDKGANP